MQALRRWRALQHQHEPWCRRRGSGSQQEPHCLATILLSGTPGLGIAARVLPCPRFPARQPQVPQLARVVAARVAGGGAHSAAVTANGDLWTWGDSSWGQCGQGRSGVFSEPPAKVAALNAKKITQVSPHAGGRGAGAASLLRTGGRASGVGSARRHAGMALVYALAPHRHGGIVPCDRPPGALPWGGTLP